MDEIKLLNLNQLHDFANHPFKVEENTELCELMRSIETEGVLVPLLARPNPNGEGYELISGHRRKAACAWAGVTDVPVVVRDLDDNQAVITMVDSNLQREHIKPSEKAYAYKMKYDAIKKKAGRKNCGQVDHNSGKRSIDVIGELCGDSAKQVQRYIKMTELIPALLDKVDDGSMGFTPAVQLSYLKKKEQQEIK